MPSAVVQQSIAFAARLMFDVSTSSVAEELLPQWMILDSSLKVCTMIAAYDLFF